MARRSIPIEERIAAQEQEVHTVLLSPPIVHLT